MMIRILHEGKCLSRKLHQVVFEEEVEQYTGKELDLMQCLVSIEQVGQRQDNPYEGEGVIQRIKQGQKLMDIDEYVIRVKKFDVSRGSFSKIKIGLR
jgi:hypothetical protein